MTATPARYAKNGKRHKRQNASKKAPVVCAWVPGRRCGDVAGMCDHIPMAFNLQDFASKLKKRKADLDLSFGA